MQRLCLAVRHIGVLAAREDGDRVCVGERLVCRACVGLRARGGSAGDGSAAPGRAQLQRRTWKRASSAFARRVKAARSTLISSDMAGGERGGTSSWREQGRRRRASRRAGASSCPPQHPVFRSTLARRAVTSQQRARASHHSTRRAAHAYIDASVPESRPHAFPTAVSVHLGGGKQRPLRAARRAGRSLVPSSSPICAQAARERGDDERSTHGASGGWPVIGPAAGRAHAARTCPPPPSKAHAGSGAAVLAHFIRPSMEVAEPSRSGPGFS